MPGKIESTAFLSQLEDMDKYLLEYRSLKLMPQVTNAFGAMRFNNNNNFEMDNDLLKNNKKLSTINGGNNNNNNNNNNNRKKFMNKQAFRLNSPTGVKFSPHAKGIPSTAPPTGTTTPLVNTHLNKATSATYPMYYNTANSNSNASLVQPPLSSSTSSPSFIPRRVDSSLSGYDPSFDYVVPTATDYTNQLSTPFPSYLNSGIHPNIGSSVGATTVGTPVASSTNLATTGSNDIINNLVGSNTFSSGVPAPLAFDQSLPTSSISASMGASGLAPTSSATDLSGNNLGSDQLLMNDLSLGWGSNHVSSAGAGNYGIWNNDMSVWS